VFETLALMGEYPNARSTGNVMSVPLPTSVLIAPAPSPARAMERISPALISGGERLARVRGPASAHDLALNVDRVPPCPRR
jgi:hypothetical protein